MTDEQTAHSPSLTPNSPSPTAIGSAYRDQVSTQSYAPRPRIAGVEVIDLPLFSDEGGDFCEITRFLPQGELAPPPRGQGLPAFRPAQLSYSFMEPGAVKAWHLHLRQDDLWFVPPADRLLVGLLDVREESPTQGVRMRLVLGAGKARLLYIPRGVAHGLANLAPTPAHLIYLVNTAFDAEHPDEQRLPFDLLGADFWTIHAE